MRNGGEQLYKSGGVSPRTQVGERILFKIPLREPGVLRCERLPTIRESLGGK